MRASLITSADYRGGVRASRINRRLGVVEGGGGRREGIIHTNDKYDDRRYSFSSYSAVFNYSRWGGEYLI